MSKKKSFKALPILAIVFFSVGLVLLAAKTVLLYASAALAGQNSGLIRIVLNTLVMGIPAVLFIIYSALTLKRKTETKAFLGVSLLVQALSSIYFAVRVALGNDNWKHIGKNYAFIVLFGLSALMCLISFCLVLKGAKASLFIILAAAFGMFVAFVLFSWNAVYMISNGSYFASNIAVLLSRLLGYTAYAVSIVFHFTALIFVACFRKKKEKEKVTVKIKSNAK